MCFGYIANNMFLPFYLCRGRKRCDTNIQRKPIHGFTCTCSAHDKQTAKNNEQQNKFFFVSSLLFEKPSNYSKEAATSKLFYHIRCASAFDILINEVLDILTFSGKKIQTFRRKKRKIRLNSFQKFILDRICFIRIRLYSLQFFFVRLAKINNEKFAILILLFLVLSLSFV